MATWDPPSDAELDVDKPIKAVDIRRIRDLSEAMAEGAVGAPLVGGLNFITTIDLASDATADFTGFDATKYDAYTFILGNVIPATDNVSFLMRTSTDGGSTYDSGATDYGYAGETVGWSGAAAPNQSSGSSSIAVAVSVGSAAGEDGISGSVLVTHPHLNKKTSALSNLSYFTNTGILTSTYGSGVRKSSADVDAVRFLMSSGDLESGTITMYGMKNA